MSWIRIRKFKGRAYRYRETRWREGKRVRSKSEYLGRGWSEIERQAAQYPSPERKAVVDPVPIEKPVPTVGNLIAATLRPESGPREALEMQAKSDAYGTEQEAKETAPVQDGAADNNGPTSDC